MGSKDLATLTLTGSARIVKGCASRNIRAGTSCQIKVKFPDGVKSPKIVVTTNGVTTAWYCRHKNRLEDKVIRVNDGNPLHILHLELKSPLSISEVSEKET